MSPLIKLSFVGDIMCKKEMLPLYHENGQFDFEEIFVAIKPFLLQSNYLFGNMETPISYNSSNLTQESYRFNAPYEFAQAVQNAGFRFLATANNHCLDRGLDGIVSTVDSLNELGFVHTGIFKKDEKDTCVIKIEDVTLGVLSYTYGTNAFANKCYLNQDEEVQVNLLQDQECSTGFSKLCYKWECRCLKSIVFRACRKVFKMLRVWKPVYERRMPDKRQLASLEQDILALKAENVDCIVVYMHIGGQYNKKANRYTTQISQLLLKHGVNIVVGSHEHVVHGRDFSKLKENQIVTYSLGNFCGLAGVTLSPFNKLAEYSVVWHIYLHPDKKTIAKTTFSITKTVLLEDGKVSVRLVSDLLASETDFAKKEKLKQDIYTIVKSFTGKSYCGDIMLEFEL